MTAQPKRYTTEQEFLDFERTSTSKHEYYAGEMFAMAGGTITHNLIASNTLASLHGQVRGTRCRVINSDMRVKIIATGLQTYPDITILCGQPVFLDTSQDVILNPTIIIEVLSPSTERYDRGMKSQHYRTIETLQAYLLISQDKYHIEHYVRQENNQWLFNEAIGIEARIEIPSVNCALVLIDVYDTVNLTSEQSISTRDAPS